MFDNKQIRFGVLVIALVMMAGCAGSKQSWSWYYRWTYEPMGNAVDFKHGTIQSCVRLKDTVSTTSDHEAETIDISFSYYGTKKGKARDEARDKYLKQHYPGAEYCTYLFPQKGGGTWFKYYQAKEDELVISATASSYDYYGYASVDKSGLEEFVMLVACTFGREKGFKYASIARTSEEAKSEAQAVTTETKGTGSVVPYYGAVFGSSKITTTTRGGGTAKEEVHSKNTIRFYNSAPDGDYFDIDLVLKSIAKGTNYYVKGLE